MPPFPLTDEMKAAILAAYQTDSKSLGMHDRSPRFGPSEIELDQDYLVKGVGIYAMIGVGIGIVQFLFTGLYMFMRCCCWRWCLKKRSDWEMPDFPGYPTFKKKYWPVLFLGFFIAVACAFSVVGILYNKKLSDTFSVSNQDKGIGPLILTILNDANGWINSIRGLITNVVDLVPTIAAQIVSPPSIRGNATSLMTTSSQFGALVGNSYSVQANGTSWYCNAACAALAYASSELGRNVNSSVMTRIDSMDQSVALIQSEFLSQATPITSDLKDAVQELVDAQGDVLGASTQSDVNKYSKDASDYDVYRNAVFLALFCCVFVTPFLVAIGLARKKGFTFRCTFCIGPFYMLIIWILFGVHWFLGMGIGDACVYLDNKMIDAEDALSGQGSLGSVANACLTNTSLVKALALEDKLAFQDAIVFPEIASPGEIDDLFNFPGLGNMTNAANALTTASFGLDEKTAIDDVLAEMSSTQTVASTTVTYTRQNVSTCDGAAQEAVCYGAAKYGSNSDRMLQLHGWAMDGLQVSATITAAIVQIQTNVTRIQNQTLALKGVYSEAIGTIGGFKNLLQGLYGQIDSFRDQAYCGFLANDFGKFKSTFCDSVGDSVQWITFALFMVGLSCFGITWCSRWSAYRVQFVAKVHPVGWDENAWMAQNGYAPHANGGTASQFAGSQPLYADPGLQMSPLDHAPNDTGSAMNVPSYEAALASYQNKNQQRTAEPESESESEPEETDDGAAADSAAAEQAAAERAAAENAAAEQAAADAAAAQAAAEAQAVQDAAAAKASRDPNVKYCESCDDKPVVVICRSCDEGLCEACDAALHRAGTVKATHYRICL